MTTVVLAADEAYLPYCLPTLAGLSRFGTAADGVVIVIPSTVSRRSIEPLRVAGKSLGLEPEFASLSRVEALADRGIVESRGHVSAFTYSKLFLADLLPGLDDILYLDVDTLIRSDINSLIGLNLNHPIAAVRELGNNGMSLFGTTRVPYFNAGVLRMSLASHRREELSAKFVDFLREPRELYFQDQDVWNWFFHDRHDAVPHFFNFFDPLARHNLPEWEMIHDPAIVHFVGPSKPWHTETRSRFAREWRQMHAECVRLAGTERDEYIRGGITSWQEFAHDSLVRFRHSSAGSRIRKTLPIGVKRSMNELVSSLVPRRSRFRDELDHALYSPTVDLRDATIHDPASATLPPKPDSGTSPSQETSHVALPSRDSGERRLLLILSAPRSGTNAFSSVLETNMRHVNIEGEVYGGFVREHTQAALQAAFPGTGDVWGPFRSTDAHGNQREIDYRRSIISPLGLEITDHLVARQEGVTSIKVFNRHLERPVLQRILEEFSPRVIILRRQVVFSFVSLLKARASRQFSATESTQTPFQLDEMRVRNYVRDLDAWYAWVFDAVRRTNTPFVDLTYEAAVEGRPDAELEPFLSDWGYLSGDGLDPTRPQTIRQDHRTDASVSRVIEEVLKLGLPADYLLRLPGPQTGEEVKGAMQRDIAGA